MNPTRDRLSRSGPAVRAGMAIPLAALAAGRDRATLPVRRALATTVTGRVPTEERAWIERIEARRRELTSDQATTGPVFDPGTEGRKGLFSTEHGEATVAAGATMLSLSPPWCVFLMRLVRELRPSSCLELGSGFGISAAYQAAALSINGSGRLTTMEGSGSIAEQARRTLSSLGLDQVAVRVAPIAEGLAEEVGRAAPFDYAFVDAEHQAGATLEHFRTLLPALAERAVLVFDDVNWDEMRPAFAQIASHPRVAASITVGRLGIAVIGGEGAEAP